MQRSTFKVLFYVKRQSEKHGQVPVHGPYRNGVSVQLQTLPFGPRFRDAQTNKASGKSLQPNVSAKLENIKTNIGKAVPASLRPGFTPSRPKESATFLGMWAMTAICCCRPSTEYLAGFLKRVGKDRAYSSYKDYCKTPPPSGLISSNTNTTSRMCVSKS